MTAPTYEYLAAGDHRKTIHELTRNNSSQFLGFVPFRVILVGRICCRFNQRGTRSLSEKSEIAKNGDTKIIRRDGKTR